MDSLGAARKRKSDANGGFAGGKRSKEMESIQHGLGSKSKPCTKFFSTAGCPFGDGCHFLHHVPGGVNIARITNLGNPTLAPPSRNHPMAPPTIPDGPPTPGVKTRMCNKYNTAEGCRFGDKCHFAHGEREIGKPALSSYDERPLPPPTMGGRFAARPEPPLANNAAAAASFGASATAKISVDASLAGAIIGKGGVNTKQICRQTGARLFIRDHESDASLRNIELEGTFDQIKQASAMVSELIVNISATTPLPARNPAGAPPQFTQGGNFKTKLCEKFGKGSCTFGDRCHFAHGESELRKAAA